VNPLLRGLTCLLLVTTLVGCAARDGSVRESAPPPAAEDRAVPPSPDSLDPWQPFNRRMHSFNMGVDRYVLRPAAKGYATVVPSPLRKGVSNFFGNLQQPLTAANLLLQGRPGQAASSMGRFVLNATLGIGGVLDPATQAGIPFHERDFGQTMGAWGWDTSRYLVLPLFGPGTVRDSVGKGVHTRASPVSWLAEEEGPWVSVLYGVDARSSVLGVDSLFDDAEDQYILVRDAYLQRRYCQINDCSDQLPDYALPDYEFELPDLDWQR
jgi:phospholipid-binding lipoprotein MlaA